jgi:predicted RNA-binding protein associated with RNAse of E/G family
MSTTPRRIAAPMATQSWPPLAPDTLLTVHKEDHHGDLVTRYAGRILDLSTPDPWVAIEARWVNRLVQVDGLSFVTGDILHEFFSPAHPYNLFSVFSPEGQLRGWYANVTYPTRVETTASGLVLTWQDLYLDVVALPTGEMWVRDEDELEEAALLTSDPDLHAAIVAAKDVLLDLWATRAFPFHQTDLNG